MCARLFFDILTRILDICWTRTMPRRTPDARLESRESRSRLASRGKPHFRLLEPGLHIGYRRLKGRKGRPAVAGTWVARHYVGGRSYVVEKIGVADDFSDSDGTIILSFAHAHGAPCAVCRRHRRSAHGASCRRRLSRIPRSPRQERCGCAPPRQCAYLPETRRS